MLNNSDNHTAAIGIINLKEMTEIYGFLMNVNNKSKLVEAEFYLKKINRKLK